jgi:hypothetical protein
VVCVLFRFYSSSIEIYIYLDFFWEIPDLVCVSLSRQPQNLLRDSFFRLTVEAFPD